VSSYTYVNAVKSSTTSSAVPGDSGNTFYVGRNISASGAATNVQIADILPILNSAALTAGQIESIYNRGNHAPFSGAASLSYVLSQASMTGQKLSTENKLARTTDATKPYLVKTGAGKL
jgi:hypothetical protein